MSCMESALQVERLPTCYFDRSSPARDANTSIGRRTLMEISGDGSKVLCVQQYWGRRSRKDSGVFNVIIAVYPSWLRCP